MFIDKESCAVLTEHDFETDSEALIESLQSHAELDSQVHQLLEVLELPIHKRTEAQLVNVLPVFKSFEAFKKMQETSMQGH